MERDLFAHLPPETIIDILSRLPVRSIALSKCVCKPWLALLETDGFFDSHLSKSAADAALAVFIQEKGGEEEEEEENSNFFEIFGVEDEVDDLERRNPISKFEFPREAIFEGSADSLLFLRNSEANFDALYVCNPITREIIELRFPGKSVEHSISYGFGVSKVSRQHKVVRIDAEFDYCHVYTLGTGRWRRVEAPRRSSVSVCGVYGGFYVDGNVYWLFTDSNFKTWISCFDLETECFSTFRSPPVRRGLLNYALVALKDGLCSIDNSTGGEIMLWLLKESGAEKRWTMAYKFDQNHSYGEFGFKYVEPVKVFENGDILMLCDWHTFCCYSIEAKWYREIYMFAELGRRRFIKSLLFTPSFRSLKRSFGMESVISF